MSDEPEELEERKKRLIDMAKRLGERIKEIRDEKREQKRHVRNKS